MDHVRWLAAGIHGDRDDAAGPIGHGADESRGKAQIARPGQGEAAARVVTDSADERDAMAQAGRLDGEIEDRAPEVLGSADQVPENFTDSDYMH